MVETVCSPYLSARRLDELGFAIAIYPATAFLAATFAVRSAMARLLRDGRIEDLSRLATLEEYRKILRFSEYAAYEARLAGGGRRTVGGQQMIPAEWLVSSFAPAVSMPDGRRYDYQWYSGAVPTDNGASGVRWEETVSVIGNGGQRLFLLPRLKLVVAITAGNYDVPDQRRPPTVVLRDVLLPALQAERAASVSTGERRL